MWMNLWIWLINLKSFQIYLYSQLENMDWLVFFLMWIYVTKIDFLYEFCSKIRIEYELKWIKEFWYLKHVKITFYFF